MIDDDLCACDEFFIDLVPLCYWLFSFSAGLKFPEPKCLARDVPGGVNVAAPVRSGRINAKIPCSTASVCSSKIIAGNGPVRSYIRLSVDPDAVICSRNVQI